MVEKRDCSFCGRPIEPGTGKMYVKKDGTRYHFDSNKCQKNMLDLKRVNRRVKWTTHYERGAAPPKASGTAPATPTEEGGGAAPAEAGTKEEAPEKTA